MPKSILDLEQMDILLFLGVPILRHFTVHRRSVCLKIGHYAVKRSVAKVSK